MSHLNSSKSEILNQNLSFYLNDYEEMQSSFICFRLLGNLDYVNIISADFSQNDQNLNDQFEIISKDLQKISFLIKRLNFILSEQNKIKILNQAIQKCSEIYQKFYQKEFDTENSTIKNNLIQFIPVELVKTVTEPAKKLNYSPLFTNHKGICRLQTYGIPIDCLVFVDLKTKVENLYDILLDKLNLHLQTIKHCYVNYYQNENNFKIETLHFFVESQNQNVSNLIITCIYPYNLNDDQLVLFRKEIHKTLDLPTDRPLLRRVDAFQFKSTLNNSNDDFSLKYLLNPHTSAKPSNVQNGKQSLVKGDYVYFHYMQDNFNDNGWGCAYRSFQTIFSWFKIQSYTQKPIPTHREIQQALVDMGDKSKEFVGSSKWIGSMEISFCLSQMLNVECKILSVSKGSEIADRARELQYHFESEGSPVMIGGGVLAHTIIGVDFNELTGDVKFLILDPHYTGSEDIKTIVNKGWVGWKDVKFWNENSYYNLCCPIRPKSV